MVELSLWRLTCMKYHAMSLWINCGQIFFRENFNGKVAPLFPSATSVMIFTVCVLDGSPTKKVISSAQGSRLQEGLREIVGRQPYPVTQICTTMLGVHRTCHHSSSWPLYGSPTIELKFGCSSLVLLYHRKVVLIYWKVTWDTMI